MEELDKIINERANALVEKKEQKEFDSKLKKCNGLNKTCFEYDEKTNTIIDGVTKMPVQLKGE